MTGRLALGGVGLVVLLAAGPAPAQSAPTGAEERLGLRVDRDAPMTISADALEATRDGEGRERVIFQQSVHVAQGDLQIECDWLEAVYPKQQAGGPDRVTARGAVRIRQQGVEVDCSEAVFERTRDLAICTRSPGPAVLRRGEDVVEGGRIVFDLRQGKLTVSGGARVVVTPREAGP